MNKTIFAAVVALISTAASAQISWVSGVYSQDFDSMATAGVSLTRPTSSTASSAVPGQLWNNNSSILGWYSSFENPANVGGLNVSATNGNWIGAGVAGTPNTIPTYDTRFIRVTDGSTTTTGHTGNYGTVNSSDRAFGMMNSGSVPSTVPVRNTIGVRFTNNSGRDLREFTVSYTGEQWRRGAGTGALVDKIDFAYRLFGAGTFNVDQMPVTVTSSWVDVNALDFNSVQTGTVGLALDGNLAVNQSVITSTVTGINWTQGSDLVLRW
ncbi:MAG: hypothetical protein K8R88_12790, partial [Armatimonadetes bacterium]|nr:hypothetical protein [Armatimonadota bacterium]